MSPPTLAPVDSPDVAPSLPGLAVPTGLWERLGRVPAERILPVPTPGTAVEADCLAVGQGPEKRLCELIDGVLVELPMGSEESELAIELACCLSNYLKPRKLGRILGADGIVRLFPAELRRPDVAVFLREDLPEGKRPTGPIWPVPALAIEVWSRTNTPAEIVAKRKLYFAAGVRLVWEIDPKRRTFEVFSGPDAGVVKTEDDLLDGGDVLPGFSLSIREFFAGLDD